MQAITEKIVKMLDDERIERRCAAAMVLGELRIKDAQAVSSLARALDEGGPLTLYAFEALESIRPAKLAQLIAPLLEGDDETLRQRATALLTREGKKGAKALLRELGDSTSIPRRRELVKLLAGNHEESTLAHLLTLIGDRDVGEAVLYALRGELERIDPRDLQAIRNSRGSAARPPRSTGRSRPAVAPCDTQGSLRGRSARGTTAGADLIKSLLLSRLKDKSWLEEPLRAARTVRLLGYVRESKLTQTLLPFSQPRHALEVRLAAIAALRRPLSLSRSCAKAAKTIMPYCLEDPPQLARAVVETLRQLELPTDGLIGELERMAESPHPEARSFAVTCLGSQSDGKAASLLVEQLDSADLATRDAAARALRGRSDIGPALVARLHLAMDDGEQAGKLGRLLMPLVSELKPAQKKKVVAAATAALLDSGASADSYVRLARAVDQGQTLVAELSAVALKHRKARRFEQAFSLLHRLDELALPLEDTSRYTALVSGLAALEDRKALARASRSTHPLLKQAVELVASGFGAQKKLVKERCLDGEALFYLGFNFVESADEDEQEFGAALLSHLAKTSPRSKLGKSAKNKLKLQGLL